VAGGARPSAGATAALPTLRKGVGLPVAPTVLCSVEDSIATITLNRPERLNAMNMALLADLGQVLAEVAADRSVRAVILTGAGRAFCAGGDLEGHPNFGEDNPAVRDRNIAAAGDVLRRLASLPQPTIAAVRGAAVAAGADLAWACDFRVAATDAKFMENFVQIGLIPDLGGTYFLPRLVGAARAIEIILLGETITAEQALHWGLVHRVVPPEELQDASLELARKLAAKAPMALALIKEGIRKSYSRELDEALAFERYGQNLLLGTPEVRAKVAEFQARSGKKS